MKKSEQDTSWESSSSWYDKIVGAKGHYYHQQVIIPGVLRILGPRPHVLDLACGQGVLARHLPKPAKYVGVDASKSLIAAAKQHSPTQTFVVHDLTQPLRLTDTEFTCATCILAVQNIPDPFTLFQSAYTHLKPSSSFIVVLNHPCFRIPRQSSWGVDEQKKVQYRRLDRYFSPLKIPIQTNPGQGKTSETTWSFHEPLSFYSAQLKKAGFVIDGIEEWTSDKKSTGKHAAMENRSRQEFPLFLVLVAKKI